MKEHLPKFANFPNFQRCKGQAGSKMKMTPPPLRVRRTLQKHVWRGLAQHSGAGAAGLRQPGGAAIQQISQIFANLRGLYLGCIEADFCNQILILQHYFFRDLQDCHSFAPPTIQYFSKFSSESFCKFSKFRPKF